MKQKTAQIIVEFLNILAFFAVGYAIYEFYTVNSAISNKATSIPFDTGTYYLLLISVVWLMRIIQYSALRSTKVTKYIEKHGNQLVIGWFIGTLVLANLIPYYLQSKLEENEYLACHDPAEISRAAKGESLIYTKSDCGSLTGPT